MGKVILVKSENCQKLVFWYIYSHIKVDTALGWCKSNCGKKVKKIVKTAIIFATT